MTQSLVIISFIGSPAIISPIWADMMPGQTPSIKDIGKCIKKTSTSKTVDTKSLRKKMQDQLEAYNNIRFQMADVLRTMVNDYSLKGYIKERILGYATHFDDMSKSVPNLDPESAPFKNFDFRLGMSFASTAIFLNSTPDVSELFKADQKDPNSPINQFAKKLDKESDAYFALLKQVRNVDSCS